MIEQIKKRRTFAIISHPDAGKTTLTEKFLLYGGAINLAGTVKGRKAAKHAVSDWMDIEKERGISVTSSAMQFNYDGFCINILDTPGHQDFSEDTYRTLMAADSAVMVIDGSKGVEAQTIKLFKVCVMRHIPIFTFINKFDREARDPYELLDEIEEVLGIRTCPVNWPIGCGKNFKGVYDRFTKKISTFTAAMGGAKEVATREFEAESPEAEEQVQTDPAFTDDIDTIMGNMMYVLKDQNATIDALRKRFPAKQDMTLEHVIPFSSDRKYSGAVFEEKGTYLMGAAQFLFPEDNEELTEKCQAYAEEGLRVLVLAHSSQNAEGTELPEGLEPLALMLLTDVIREEAPDTLAFFDSQEVDLKVISGDDPVTVAAIARRAGLKNADSYVDATTLTTEEALQDAVAQYSVFGRVTPQQKKAMVQALQAQGHTVAMTGDGVNDVLALKEADCSIAMAQGSDAAKNIANVVLLDSNFASMPHIVNQGRRVVNNIRTAASMFLIKTMFSVMLSLLTIFFGNAYPFEPIQMSLISACAVGIPTFLLAQENNYEKIDHTFLRHVFINAFPAAITITFCVFAVMLVCQNVYHSMAMLNTACVLVTGWNYMAALKTVYAPLNTYRKVIIYGMQFIFFAAAVIFQKLLSLGSLDFGMIILVFILMTFAPVLIDVITVWLKGIYARSLDQEKPGRFTGFIDKLRK